MTDVSTFTSFVNPQVNNTILCAKPGDVSSRLFLRDDRMPRRYHGDREGTRQVWFHPGEILHGEQTWPRSAAAKKACKIVPFYCITCLGVCWLVQDTVTTHTRDNKD